MVRQTRLGVPASLLSISGLAFLAALSLGVRPAVADEEYVVRYVEIASESGAANTWNGHGFGAGVALEDFDVDGDPDLLLLNSINLSNRLFINAFDNTQKSIDGVSSNPTFAEITATCGLSDLGNSKAAIFVDYDNDGLPDILVSNYDETVDNRPDHASYYSSLCLYRNLGDGRFKDVTVEAGLQIRGVAAYGVSAADVDRDGYVDFFVANRGGLSELSSGGGFNYLFRNMGDGTFTDVSIASGIADVRSYTFQGSFFDYDHDGDDDLYLCSDKLGGNQLYRNESNFTFTNVSEGSGSDIDMNGMCVTFGDIDNDLDFDVFVTNTPEGHALLRNNGNGSFSEIAGPAGVAGGRIGWGARFLDADSDGWIDLYVVHFGTFNTNQLFSNLRNSTFSDIAGIADCQDPSHGFGFAVADFDLNGENDFIISNWQSSTALYVHSGTTNPWLRARLIGVESNRDAIGARVVLQRDGGPPQLRQVVCGDSYLSHSEKELHFGLGEKAPTRLIIEWPSGLNQTIESLQANRRYRIVEGHGIQTGTILSNHRVEASGSRVDLFWETVQWPDDAGFRIARVPVALGVPGTEETLAIQSDSGRYHKFVDPLVGIAPGTYRYRLYVQHATGAETLMFESEDLDLVPTPVQLSDFQAAAGEGRVELQWRFSPESLIEIARVQVQRALHREGPYRDLVPAGLAPRVQMRYVDLEPVDAERSWYRLMTTTAAGSQVISRSLAVDLLASLRQGLTAVWEEADGSLRLGFALSQTRSVRLALFDVRGRLLADLVQGNRTAGRYTMHWNRQSRRGERVPRGVYFLKLAISGQTEARKVTLLRP